MFVCPYNFPSTTTIAGGSKGVSAGKKDCEGERAKNWMFCSLTLTVSGVSVFFTDCQRQDRSDFLSCDDKRPASWLQSRSEPPSTRWPQNRSGHAGNFPRHPFRENRVWGWPPPARGSRFR